MPKKPTGKPNGRPKIIWDDAKYKEFEKLCFLHCTLMEICSWFDIDDVTLDKLLKSRYGVGFSEIFPVYSAQGKISLRRSLFQLATDPDPKKRDFRAMKWLTTNHLGMSERIAQKIEVEERRVVNIDLSWADEDPGNGSSDKDAQKDATTKKV